LQEMIFIDYKGAAPGLLTVPRVPGKLDTTRFTGAKLRFANASMIQSQPSHQSKEEL